MTNTSGYVPWRTSLLTVSYSCGLVLFSLVARDIYEWLAQSVGREGIERALWGVMGMVVVLVVPMLSSLSWRAIAAMCTLLLLAGLYAGSFEILEERTHLLKYGTLAVLLCADNRGRPLLPAATVALCGVVWVALIDETVQSFTPGRVGDFRDVGFDLMGGILGVALWSILRLGRATGKAILEVSDSIR